MSDPTRQQLQQAYQLIKNGQREQAGVILIAILKQDRENADAWWLLANASNDPEKAKQALENVLRVRPDDARAHERLDKLNARTPPEPPPSSHFSMPLSPTAAPATADDDPFASFSVPSWGNEPSSSEAESLPVVSPFGDLDLDQLDMDADLPFPDEPAGAPPPTLSGSVISRPGARTVEPSALPDDPFGSVTYGGDPFADVSRNDDPFAGGRRSGDPFDSVNTPISTGGIRALPGSETVTPRRSGANPVVVVLLVFGVLGAVACIACVALAASGTAVLGPQINEGIQQVQQALQTVTAMPDFATLAAQGNGQSLPSGLNNRGRLSYGQALQRTVDTFTDDSWTFNGTSGDQITIEADSANGDLDPQLALYNPAKTQIAENDDIATGNHNARITITLPSTGTYTIVVSAFGSGGDYTLKLTRQ